MAVKAAQLHESAMVALHEATQTPENWMELLRSVAPFYKYSFENALLISSQRPDAVACATMQQWNRHNLWIRKGSKAIHAIDPNNPYQTLRVFDISDINARPNRLPQIWQLREDQRSVLEDALTSRWGIEADASDPSLTLYSAIMEATAEIAGGYQNDFQDARVDGPMADMDEQLAESTFANLACNSAYVIASYRLNLPMPEGVDAEGLLGDIDFFTSWGTQIAIGQAAHEIAGTVLREIERGVKAAERNNPKTAEKTLDNRAGMWNNMGDGLSQSQSINTSLQVPSEPTDGDRGEPPNVEAAEPTPTEREDEHGDPVAGDSVQGEPGRDARSGADVPEATGGQHREVRRDAEGLPPAAPQGDLRSDEHGGDAEAAPDGRERTGEGEGRRAGESDAAGRADAGQEQRSAGLDSTDEQPKGPGGGDREGNGGIRLNSMVFELGDRGWELREERSSFFTPSQPAQQISMFSSPAFGLPQEVIDQALVLGSNQGNSRYRIAAHFKKDFPAEENRAFLIREYKTGGRGFMLDGKQYAVWWNAEGIRISQGTTARTQDATLIPYEQAAARIRELLDLGRYMSNDELGFVDQIERREIANRICDAYRDDMPDARPLWDRGTYPDESGQIAGMLIEPTSRDMLIARLEDDIDRANSAPSDRRRWHDLGRLKADAQALRRPTIEFTGDFPMPAMPETFITQDEIDAFLTRGGSYSGSKERTYRYFTEPHTQDERAAYLKEAYGIGGSSHALSGADDSWADYDSKGIVLKRGDITNPSAVVKLNWKQAAKCVGELIDHGWFLTAAEMDRYMQNHLEEPITIEPEPAEGADAYSPASTEQQTAAVSPSEQTWVSDMLEQHRDDLLRRVTESPDYPKALGSPDEGNFRMEVDSIIEGIAAGLAAEDIDLYRAYCDYPEFRDGLHEYILEQTVQDYQRQAAEHPELHREAAQPAEEEPARPQLEPNDAPEVQAAMAEYNQQKHLHPDSIVLVQVGSHYETYGEDAALVQRALPHAEYTRIFDGKHPVAMSGFDPASQWRYYLKQLCDQGNSVLLRGLSESGEYETVQDVRAEEYVPIGATLKIEGHDFQVDSVNRMTATVSLRDMTMFASGYPLFRNEPIEYVHDLLDEQDYFFSEHWRQLSAERVSNDTQDASEPTVSSDTPIDEDGRVSTDTTQEPAVTNYRIHDDHLGEGGQRTKADRNIEAVRTLKTIESEGRGATAAEQETLAQYVGWGGIPQIFDEANGDWSDRRETLKSLLTEDEYKAARASTLNAHYTSPTVIRAIYQGLENLGFRRGNILEPSCGVGNFFGMLPEAMQDSKLTGVELDSITGRIAQKLYPEAKISVQGFESAPFLDSFFDAAVGNVPFGAYSLPDTRYDKYHFRIHDYFFAKALDKVRPGGIVAFITSKGTMDKQDSSVRRYIAQRADLLGAIRLPNTAFKANAGTDVTTDILFLQKRKNPIDIEPSWIHVGTDENGVPVNAYFLENPDMLLGTMSFDDSMYGSEKDTTCHAIPGAELSEQLAHAIQNIQGQYVERTVDAPVQDDSQIPADPAVPNFSYAIQDGKIYYRRNEWMEKQTLSAPDERRMRGMIALRDTTRQLIQAQLAGADDQVVGTLQIELNERYDDFTKQYGLLSSRKNAQVFGEDDGYYLLTSLEILDDEHKLERKADMFTRRTIAVSRPIDHVDTAPEALAVSMAERAMVDLDFMADLTGMDKDKLIDELTGLIYQNPIGNPGPYEQWQTADEYLSGDIRQKLKAAEAAVEFQEGGERFKPNIEALQAVVPKDLEPHEIGVRLGATWIPASDITDFVHELLNTPYYLRRRIQAEFVPLTGTWNITNKTVDLNNVVANTQYGTDRRNAYRIIEDSLNLRDVRVFDTVLDENGREKRVLNQKETILAQQKQTAIREAFQDWIWRDPNRRERLCRVYNDTYNCIRPREYDGSHLRFSGMNPELQLRPHQKNAVARVLYGGNTLLAHTVGAGKTAVMVASVMEKMRIGLGHKALIAVPNHLTEQTAAEFLRFFPAAKVLVATRKDFEKQNRKRFVGRIATGDYDAIIMGHSQFERIPISRERQREMLEAQIQEIVDGIEELKYSRGERFSIKEMERTKKSLETRLKKLNSDENKDSVVTFEELGVDMLYVDEAHGYKNLACITKMRNVAGINTVEAKKSSDMYMKCRYISELTGDRGVVFATGTPISNSMTELFTMQRYLQHTELQRRGLAHFDSWAANFGETQTAIELAPEGTGYRLKTRFAKFFNLPELMAMFKQVADIQTPDMLNLPVPELKGGKTQNIKTEASEYQKEMVAQLAERAEKIRQGGVDPHEDNMLNVTNDGRLLALDARLIDPTLPDDPNSKVNTCVREIMRIYKEGDPERLTQLVFCDLSTPRTERVDGVFDDVYHDLRRKLIREGIPENEIAFIHDANTEQQKDDLFAKVRKGAVRVLIGSTAKMGAGTNVQTKLKALHHLDCPWRPSDLQQRDGRILRQGNGNKEVEVLRYITQDTFDAYSYQLVENKQKFISQIFTSKSPARGAEDLDEMALSYAEVKALAAGNPAIREKMDLDVQVARLKLLKSNWQSERYRLERRVSTELPTEITRLEHQIDHLNKDMQIYEQHRPSEEGGFSITLMGSTYDKRVEAGEKLTRLSELVPLGEVMKVGEYCGFTLRIRRPEMMSPPKLEIEGEGTYMAELGESVLGNITRVENLAKGMVAAKEKAEAQLANAKEQLKATKEELARPWAQEQELKEKSERLAQLNVELDVGGRDNSAAAMGDDDEEPEREAPSRERTAVR